MGVVATDPLSHHPSGVWELKRWQGSGILAGVVDKSATRPWDVLQAHVSSATTLIQAQQLHGSSLAMVRTRSPSHTPIPGCDALLTDSPRIALVIRTADCIPVFFIDPKRRLVALAHAGWRGLFANILPRVVCAFRTFLHSPTDALHVAIGPAIRGCCYEVGADFPSCFQPFVRQQGTRRFCDLVAMAVAQLGESGIHPAKILDTGRCTVCEESNWFSLRREGPSSGRMLSFIVIGER